MHERPIPEQEPQVEPAKPRPSRFRVVLRSFLRAFVFCLVASMVLVLLGDPFGALVDLARGGAEKIAAAIETFRASGLYFSLYFIASALLAGLWAALSGSIFDRKTGREE